MNDSYIPYLKQLYGFVLEQGHAWTSQSRKLYLFFSYVTLVTRTATLKMILNPHMSHAPLNLSFLCETEEYAGVIFV